MILFDGGDALDGHIRSLRREYKKILTNKPMIRTEEDRKMLEKITKEKIQLSSRLDEKYFLLKFKFLIDEIACILKLWKTTPHIEDLLIGILR